MLAITADAVDVLMDLAIARHRDTR
jgi:hypothetical protein